MLINSEHATGVQNRTATLNLNFKLESLKPLEPLWTQELTSTCTISGEIVQVLVISWTGVHDRTATLNLNFKLESLKPRLELT